LLPKDVAQDGGRTGHGHPHGHDLADEAGGRDAAGPPCAGRARRLGIGGPVGSGKTALVADLCRTLGSRLDIAVVTNDIYTTEDADFLKAAAVLPTERIVAVETGCCPHTAIRDDIAANAEAVAELEARFSGLDLVIIESGGDNLTATFSYGLIDRQIFVVDVAGGDKVPRKGGPGVIRSDLLVINKTDLAPMVGADLLIMESDARRMRTDAPVLMVSVREGSGMGSVRLWVEEWVVSERVTV
jgi:urease accessory protein